MRVPSLFRQAIALGVMGVSVFIVTGCQGEDKPAPLPELPATTGSAGSKTKPTPPPTGVKAAASAASGARQPRFGEPPSK